MDNGIVNGPMANVKASVYATVGLNDDESVISMGVTPSYSPFGVVKETLEDKVSLYCFLLVHIIPDPVERFEELQRLLTELPMVINIPEYNKVYAITLDEVIKCPMN
jgi:hypothetical protein